MLLDELSTRVARELCGERAAWRRRRRAVSAAPDARTVRYYTTLGLLDRPTIEARQARYGERHLLQLLAIKALQAVDLPLAEIQQRLYARSDAELRALSRRSPPKPVNTPRRGSWKRPFRPCACARSRWNLESG